MEITFSVCFERHICQKNNKISTFLVQKNEGILLWKRKNDNGVFS